MLETIFINVMMVCLTIVMVLATVAVSVLVLHFIWEMIKEMGFRGGKK